MRVQEAVDACRDVLQLAPGEASIYVHLCLGGPAKAGDLATALHLHRNEVYRTAARLLARGVLQMTTERPARYAAVAPEKVFDDRIAERLHEVDGLREARGRVAPFLRAMELPPPADKRGTYKVVQGRQEIDAARDRLVQEARASVEWATTFPPAVHLADLSGGIDGLARRAEAGVRVRCAVQTTEAGWALLARLARSPHAALCAIEAEAPVRFWIADGQELLMLVVNDPSESPRARDEVAIHTTAPGFVQAERAFFEQSWRAGRVR